ncbi:hypothetical protein EVJ58_g10688 [Rhodofomes roseus]|uniref:Uncharacterized protein n=1 Tax=Rhodofomes roseus TaxID=34475 RepID=A0A4Y9XM94_9APHY|nr:hypothetical protein EVJ58_g10688 [Rhodofomes roseus]
MSLEGLLDCADFTANCSTSYNQVIVPLTRKFWPRKVLRKGDKYLGYTLEILDSSRPYIGRKLHIGYLDKHDALFYTGQTLRQIKGIPNMSQYLKFRNYKYDAKVLYHEAEISSREARSKFIRKQMPDQMDSDSAFAESDVDELDVTEQSLEPFGPLDHHYLPGASIPLIDIQPSRRDDGLSIRDDSSILNHPPMWANDTSFVPGTAQRSRR